MQAVRALSCACGLGRRNLACRVGCCCWVAVGPLPVWSVTRGATPDCHSWAALPGGGGGGDPATSRLCRCRSNCIMHALQARRGEAARCFRTCAMPCRPEHGRRGGAQVEHSQRKGRRREEPAQAHAVSFVTAVLMAVALCFHSILEVRGLLALRGKFAALLSQHGLSRTACGSAGASGIGSAGPAHVSRAREPRPDAQLGHALGPDPAESEPCPALGHQAPTSLPAIPSREGSGHAAAASQSTRRF